MDLSAARTSLRTSAAGAPAGHDRARGTAGAHHAALLAAGNLQLLHRRPHALCPRRAAGVRHHRRLELQGFLHPHASPAWRSLPLGRTLSGGSTLVSRLSERRAEPHYAQSASHHLAQCERVPAPHQRLLVHQLQRGAERHPDGEPRLRRRRQRPAQHLRLHHREQLLLPAHALRSNATALGSTDLLHGV